MKFDAYYVLPDGDTTHLPQMKALVAKAESIIGSLMLLRGESRERDSWFVDVERTDYSDEQFGIRIYLGNNVTLHDLDAKDIKRIDLGKSWFSLTLNDEQSIQFVFKSGLVPPKSLPAA